MPILSFRRKDRRGSPPNLCSLVEGYSIEVMPRTLARLDRVEEMFPAGTQVFIAHIDGTPIADMVGAARRLREAGYEPVPHFSARSIPSAAELKEWVAAYRGEADIRQALLLAGGARKPAGTLDSSIQLVESGAFDDPAFSHLFFAGHPEGTRDIDADGGTAGVDAAQGWKKSFAERTDAEVQLVTQFVFDAQPVIDWMARSRKAGMDLPVRVGLAGPAKLQTLIKFAVACGVGPSLNVLRKRAVDITKMVKSVTPDSIANALTEHAAVEPDTRIGGIHLFPLGGIAAAAEWAENARTRCESARTARN